MLSYMQNQNRKESSRAIASLIVHAASGKEDGMIEHELSNGVRIPVMGYGVFQMTSDEVREHLPEAIAMAIAMSIPRMATTTKLRWAMSSPKAAFRARTSSSPRSSGRAITDTRIADVPSTHRSSALAWITRISCCSINPMVPIPRLGMPLRKPLPTAGSALSACQTSLRRNFRRFLMSQRSNPMSCRWRSIPVAISTI